MPLSMSQTGSSLKISKITGRDETRRFLNSLGFVVGDQISVVSESGGNLIIRIKNTRVAIDKVMASRILVSDCK